MVGGAAFVVPTLAFGAVGERGLVVAVVVGTASTVVVSSTERGVLDAFRALNRGARDPRPTDRPP